LDYVLNISPQAAAVRAREMSVMEAEAAERKAESGEDGGGFAVFG
jgi:hypothetical protein